MKAWQGIAKADQFHSFLPSSSMSLFEFCNLSKILLSVTKDCYSLYHVHCTFYIRYRRITKIAHSSLPSSVGWVALSLLIVVVHPAAVTFLPLCHFLFLQFPPRHSRHPSCSMLISTQWPSYWAVLDSEKDMLYAISILPQQRGP